MKFFLLLLLTAFTQRSFSQDILIPYRAGDKFGLCNQNGKIIVPPAYDRVAWLSNEYFITSKEVTLNDTLEATPYNYRIRNKKVIVKGLLYKNREIFKDEPFRDVEIIPNKCIIAKSEGRYTDYTKEQFARYSTKEKFISIFSLEGKNLYPALFKRLQKFDTAGISARYKGNGRYILFGSQNFVEQYSLFVLDADKQKITEWLLKDVRKLKVKETGYRQNNILFEYSGANGLDSLLLVDYKSGKFMVTKLPLAKKSGTGMGNGTGNGSGINVEERISDAREMDLVAVQQDGDMKSTSEAYVPPPFKPYNEYLKDSLFYVTGPKEKKFISLPADARPIFTEVKGSMQYHPVIYKQHQKFGWIKDGQVGEPLYDSLVYMGITYIAYQTTGGRLKCGVLGADGAVIIPFMYDSIAAGIKLFDVDDQRGSHDSLTRFILKEAGDKYSYNQKKRNPYALPASDRVTVFKNGLVGVFNMKNEVIIPVEYELIAENSLNYMRPMESKFFILKKNGLYGITGLAYNKDREVFEMKNTIGPFFTQVPCYVIKDYYNVKGFTLIGLYDEHFRFAGYGNEKGMLYFKE